MTNHSTTADVLSALTSDRALSIVRAPRIADVTALCDALVAGGIRVVELTFTTPGLPDLLREASDAAARTGALVGAGTVLRADQARQAVAAGAAFVVTPGQGPDAADVVRIVHDAGAAAVIGALTPSEVMRAMELGADVIKIFPARLVGPTYLTDLRGPIPDVPLVPSGGVNATNAGDYLRAGALAVTAGTSVVSPTTVAEGRWQEISAAAAAFCRCLTPAPIDTDPR